jgi:3-hydroxyisobutyrate dehydrogenase
MMSGDPDVVAEVRPLIAPMSRAVVFCGPIGNALLMKLAVNLHLTTLLAGLAEAVHFADGHDLDLELLKEVIEEGPMRSDYTSAKLGKLISRDFSIQAATSDAYNISRLISKTARAAGLASPLVDLSQKLYGKSVNIGNGRQDMASVIEAFEYYALNNKLAIAQLRTCGE